MSTGFDHLLSRYENGQLSRRDLLAALTTLFAAAPAVRGDAAPAVGPVKQMNHVSIFVPDVQKSKQFYQDVFGLPLLTNQPPGVNLSTGAGFLGIYPAQGGAAKGSINHLCLGVDNFDADVVLKTLSDRGVQARIRLRGDTKELYLTDPDGISVQLQDTKYIGGTGPLGDVKP
jgi:catechol 2,3-dioxygenase-like lactoylglutathione lyase family enzyme